MVNCVIYVDNDNIKFSKYDKIISKIFSKYNNTNIKIFLNEIDLNNLDNISKLKYNIFLCNSPARSKNSADCHIMIECMDDIYSNKYETFIIISNDTDFIPLCKRIRSDNKKCVLCYDGNFNSYLNEIYDETFDLSQLLKLENDKKQKALELQKQNELKKQQEIIKQEELEKQKKEKEQKEIKRIDKLLQYKKNQLSPILEEIFNNDIDHISISQLQKKLDKNKKINYKKDIYGNSVRYKHYLILYISNKYYIKDDNIYMK